MRFNFLTLIWAIGALQVSQLNAEETATISGKVVDLKTGRGVCQALVMTEPGDFQCRSGRDGRFSLVLPPGVYQLKTVHPNYYINIVPRFRLSAGETREMIIELLPGSPEAVAHMNLGGITVTSEQNTLPKKIFTEYITLEGEIEHLQANSLRDILDLLPGLVRGAEDPAGLSRTARVNLRNPGVPDPFGLFGTKIMVDGFALSNNVNRQTGVGVGYGTKVYTTGNTSIDLRLIPADPIQSVKIVPGIAPAQYGDLTEGLILVQTRSGIGAPRLKLKTNLDTKELSFLGSVQVNTKIFDYFMNYARSERDPRRSGDEYGRLSGQLKFSANQPTSTFFSQQIITFYRNFEEDLLPEDPLRTQAYNRDYSLAYNSHVQWRPKSTLQIQSRQSIRYTRRKSYLSRLERADILPVAGATKTGTTLPADTLTGPYISEVKTLGKEFQFSWDASVQWQGRDPLGMTHDLAAGIQASVETNRGEGKVFDPLRPPGGNFTIRPYPFDKEPPISSLSFYLQNEIVGKFGLPFSANLGLRYDLFQPRFSFRQKKFLGAEQGSFVSPRIGVRLQILPATQVRFGFGRAVKRPSQDMIFRQPYYREMLDIGIVDGDSLQLISTYRFDRENHHLKGYPETQLSISLDQHLPPFTLSLTGYWQKTDQIPEQLITPVTLHHYFFPDFLKDPTAKWTLDTLFVNFSNLNPYYNLSWTKKYGVEFLLVSQRLARLGSRIRISCAYNRLARGSSQPQAGSAQTIQRLSPHTGKEETLTVYPLFAQPEGWHDRLVLKYYVDFLSRPLGLWLTFTAEQVPWERQLAVPEKTPLEAKGYFSIYGYQSLSQEEAKVLGLVREFSSRAQKIVNISKDKWLFSVHLTKSLNQFTEFSLFVVNLLNDPGDYLSPYTGGYVYRNPDIFYGVEISSQLPFLTNERK